MASPPSADLSTPSAASPLLRMPRSESEKRWLATLLKTTGVGGAPGDCPDFTSAMISSIEAAHADPLRNFDSENGLENGSQTTCRCRWSTELKGGR